MNCSECVELMPELTRAGLIEARERDGAHKHIAECASCSRRFELERRLQLSLSALRDEDNGLRAPDHIKHNLLSAFRERQSVEQEIVPAFNRSRRIAIAAVAALLVALIGYAFWPGSRPDVGSQGTVATVSGSPSPTASVPGPTPAVSEPEIAKIFGGAEEMRLSGDKSRNKKNRARVEKPDKPEKPEKADRQAPAATVSYVLGEFRPLNSVEVASDFIPLVATSGLPPSDRGQVIRVSLSKSAMAYFGLPVPIEAPGQRVAADVLVTEDGLARAVRFVR